MKTVLFYDDVTIKITLFCKIIIMECDMDVVYADEMFWCQKDVMKTYERDRKAQTQNV